MFRDCHPERSAQHVVEGSGNAVLQVQNLSVAFGFDKNGKPREGMKPLQVTDKVSFEINPGEFFALVGESGCGKSVTAAALTRLPPASGPGARIGGRAILRGRDLQVSVRTVQDHALASCFIPASLFDE